jgi:hypothetical protein
MDWAAAVAALALIGGRPRREDTRMVDDLFLPASLFSILMN